MPKTVVSKLSSSKEPVVLPERIKKRLNLFAVRACNWITRVLPKKESNLSTVRKICLFKIGAIGDVVMTTPLVQAVCERFPNARIDYWVGKWAAPVLENSPFIDRIIPFDEQPVLRKKPFRVLAICRKIRKENYDAIFMLDFSYLAGAFAFFCGVPIRIGFDREGEGFFFNRTAQYGARVYDADSYLKLGKLVGADSRKRPMRIFLTDKEKYFARKFFKEHNLVQSRTVAISPGGAKNPAYDMDAKRWPAERFAEVAEELAKIGKVILVVGGPGDVQFAKAIINKVPKAVNAAGMFSLRETAALIARASRLVCVDSGLMHVSVAVGTPVVAIFGPTDPMKLAPRGREHRILWKHPDKMPCYVDGVLHECPDKNRCIDRVSVTDVIRVLE